MTRRAHLGFGLLATAVVLGAVVHGFWIVGSPHSRRAVRLDDRRIEDLRAIVYEIQDQVLDPRDSRRLRRALPASLEEVAAGARYRRLTIEDPESGSAYEYEVIDAHTYRLCATFSVRRDRVSGVYWNHPAGRHCFTIDVLDPP